MPNMEFIHNAPRCILLMPNTKGGSGAYFECKCTICPDVGIECNADGSQIKCFNHDPEGWVLQYDEEKMELKAMLLAMNGGSLLEEWEVKRRDGASS